MNALRHISLLAAAVIMTACAKEPPPRSVQEFISNPILLEAALVRCSNRSETRYEAECINAREAVKIVEAEEEVKRRAQLEKQSKSKRDALRRTQQAAAEARRRAADSRRKRDEDAYLSQFGELPPSAGDSVVGAGNEPLAVIPEAVDELTDTGGGYVESLPSAGSNAPVIVAEPEPEPEPEPEVQPANDLASIRDELRRRNEDGNDD